MMKLKVLPSCLGFRNLLFIMAALAIANLLFILFYITMQNQFYNTLRSEVPQEISRTLNLRKELVKPNLHFIQNKTNRFQIVETFSKAKSNIFSSSSVESYSSTTSVKLITTQLISTNTTTVAKRNIEHEILLKPAIHGDLSVLSDPSFKIPPILHDVYLPDSEIIPKALQPLVMSMLRENKGYQYWLWTNRRIEQFLKMYFPQYHSQYQNLPGLLFKSDFIRYFLLYYVGGVYADMDMRAHRRLDSLLQKYECIVGREPDLAAHLIFDKDYIVANYFMASRPRHPFYKYVFQKFLNKNIGGHVLQATGPFFLTTSLDEYAKINNCSKPNLTLLYDDIVSYNYCGCAFLPWRHAYCELDPPRYDGLKRRCINDEQKMNYPRRQICELWHKYQYSYNMTTDSTFVCHISLHMGERAGGYRFGPEDITLSALIEQHRLLES